MIFKELKQMKGKQERIQWVDFLDEVLIKKRTKYSLGSKYDTE